MLPKPCKKGVGSQQQVVVIAILSHVERDGVQQNRYLVFTQAFRGYGRCQCDGVSTGQSGYLRVILQGEFSYRDASSFQRRTLA